MDWGLLASNAVTLIVVMGIMLIRVESRLSRMENDIQWLKQIIEKKE